MEQCQILREYSIFVDRVKYYNRKNELGIAIDLAIDECIEKGVLVDFLTRKRSKVKNSILTEYDEAFVMNQLS